MARGLLLPHGRRLLLLPRPRGFSAAAAVPGREPLHVCVVGSGPAGFYTADKMLKGHECAQVDIIDRLPIPFGLVRSGVAPDHPETKIVVNQFSRVAANGRCSFVGNVTLGSDVSLSERRRTYDVVVLAYGAESDRSLGIPGEDLRGIHSAREFVWWYNGHPDMCNLDPDLKSTDSAVVLGQGNVALDVARILLHCTTELAATDIADYALDALRSSTIRNVYLVGRWGPVQAACTAKELREILGLKNVRVCIKEADLVTSPADEEEMRNSRIQRRVFELLSKAATMRKDNNNDDQKELHFVFFRKPTRFLPSEDGFTVGAVQLEKTYLKDDGVTGKQVAVGTGEFEDLKCGLVLKSIGYKSLPVEGLPFDKYRGVVPNLKGRVLSSESEAATVEPGLYVVGWLKRGPTGIVATNLHCPEETIRPGGERTPNRRRRSFTWLQRRVDNSQTWTKIRICLQDGKVCQKLGDKETLSQFVNNNLSPIQVDKLKVLADSLANSSSKAEQRILGHRYYNSLPPISKAYGTLCFFTTVQCQLHILSPDFLVLYYPFVFKKFQVVKRRAISDIGNEITLQELPKA